MLEDATLDIVMIKIINAISKSKIYVYVVI